MIERILNKLRPKSGGLNLVNRVDHEPVDGYEDVRVKMVKDHFNDIPKFELPDGYTIRWFERGDDAHWNRIHQECEGYGELKPDLFESQYGSDLEVLSRRIAFVCRPDGLPVSTNSAWMNDWNGKHWGRVHWVATSRSEQGKGLSKPLMSVVCERLAELGHDRVHLTTNTSRARAIALYAAFGFKAYWDTNEERDAWRLLIKELEKIGKTVDIAEGS